MEEIIIPIIAIGSVIIGLPWLIFHYVTKWKQLGTITGEDEKLLDELHYTARQLEERLITVERIIAADHPDFRPLRPERDDTGYDLSRRN